MPTSHTPIVKSVPVLAADFPVPGIELVGSADAETLLGSAGDDRIIGLGGADLIRGYDGNDTISASGEAGVEGNATVYGGAGFDNIDVGEFSTLVYGGTDDDDFEIFGFRVENVQHTLFGGQGIDEVFYRPDLDSPLRIDLNRVFTNGIDPTDRLFGIENVSAASGNDTIFGNTAGNVIEGLRGQDHIYGGLGYDSIDGGFDADSVFGGNGNDSIKGSNGADLLFGGYGSDILYGGRGLDVLTGGKGSDRLYGGASPDRFIFNLGSDAGGSDRIFDFQVGSDKIVIGQVAGAGNKPDITITILSNGLQMVTVGDAGNPIFEIGVRAHGDMISLSDIEYLFV
jgi:Ca2+-binding RTX toxin-like protein